MSAKNRRFLIAYVSLVVLPVAGLLGVLKSGRTLMAPSSVGGVWKLRINPAQLTAMPCGRSLASTPEPVMTISQSGQRFTLEFADGPRATASGLIEGATLSASLRPLQPWSNESGCGNDRVLTMAGTVDPAAVPRTVAGTLSVSDCPSCTPVEFHAVREARPGSKGGY